MDAKNLKQSRQLRLSPVILPTLGFLSFVFTTCTASEYVVEDSYTYFSSNLNISVSS